MMPPHETQNKLDHYNLHQGSPGGSDSKESACSAGDTGSILGSGRSPGEGMAVHSSILGWKIPWTEEPRGGKELDLSEHR